MTSAYNKRPRARGKVRDSKSKSTVAFIEWILPKNVAARVMLIVLGMAPFVILSALGWLSGKSFELSKLGLLLSMGDMAETLTFADLATEQLEKLSRYLTLSAAVLVISVIFLVFAVLSCKVKARNPLAYLGFGLGAVSHLIFVVGLGEINRLAAQRPVEVSLFSYLALLAGLVSMVYCVKYPIATAAKGKRNSPFTRIVTSFVPVKGDGFVEGGRKVVFTVALISFIYFASTLGVDMFNEWRAESLRKAQERLIGSEVDYEGDVAFNILREREAKPLPDYLEWYRLYPDTVGHIVVGDRIDYSVLQTDNNHYYLDFDKDGNASRGGWIFADFRNNFTGHDISDNTILYGHNITTGTYFAALSNYYSKTVDGSLSFYKDNPVITFNTLYDKAEWKVFATVLFNTQPDFGEIFEYWNKIDFADEDDFHDYILNIMDRSVLFTDVDLQYGDQLLTLSTCYWPMGQTVDTRIGIFARRVRPGESAAVNVDKATHNRQAKRFDEEARRLGQTWPGHRVWDTSYLRSYSGG
ncbi:MAG: class B sortase [Oscillospiraceae bacterium]|nr:class B sortase [Oscillospiraceae bacterium]